MTIVSFEMPATPAARTTAYSYPPSWLFDFANGDYILDGGGQYIEADGYQAWVQRCVKALLTQRYAFPIYSRNYGTNFIKTTSYPKRDLARSMIQREISESLLSDPGTGAVRNFVIDWVGDELTIKVDVIPRTPAGRVVQIVMSQEIISSPAPIIETSAPAPAPTITINYHVLPWQIL